MRIGPTARRTTGDFWVAPSTKFAARITKQIAPHPAIVEAFFHAHYFLRMAGKYGCELDEAPQALPSGWAAVRRLVRRALATPL